MGYIEFRVLQPDKMEVLLFFLNKNIAVTSSLLYFYELDRKNGPSHSISQ